ncbi:hypothetical protein EPO05_01815, partial [Patescibacteria group bacterium]
IIRHLEQQGHKIKVVSSNHTYDLLRDKCDIQKVFGLRFALKNNEVKYVQTFFRNLFHSPQGLKDIQGVLKIFGEFKPDIVLSDFEPISAFVSHLKSVPLISVDNQHRLTRVAVSYPRKYWSEAHLAEAVTTCMVPSADAYVVLDFAQDEVTEEKTYLVPPILRPAVLASTTTTGEHVLIYISGEFKRLPEVLKNLAIPFRVYGWDENKSEGNITFWRKGAGDFLGDLASCRAVVANAGFSLISEALHLGKPYLAMPIGGQFEQVLNAYRLEQLGYGEHCDILNQESIEHFLGNMEKYRQNLNQYEKFGNERALKKIDERISYFAKSI